MKEKLRQLLLVFIIFSCSVTIYSIESYEKYINSNLGTEFWFTIPPALIESGNSSGNFVKIFVNSDIETEVTISVAGKGYSSTSKVLPGVSYEFNLEPQIAQPYVKTGLDPVFPSDVFRNSGIRVTSSFPVSVFVLVKYNSTSEGFIALPINVLGKEYIVSSYGDASVYYPVYNSFPSLSGIVAVNDGTEVSFTLGGNGNTQTSSGQKTGETLKKILNKGDVWMISSRGRDGDLTGSKIESNKPVAVVSGSHAANIPTINKYASYIVEMELPAYSWGKSFHVPSITGRKFSPVLRIFAKENNTDIFINGSFYKTIEFSGGVAEQGFIELRISELLPAKAAKISADKPISITLYNTGVEEDGLPEPPGSPFMLMLSPEENYYNDISFAIPATVSNQGYANNFMTIIYRKDNNGNIPNDLQIGKYDGISYNYKSLSEFTYIERFDFINTNFASATIKLESVGNYSIKSGTKFISYMFGTERNAAYGFPAGLKLMNSNLSDKEAPKSGWVIDCNGIVHGETKDLPDDASIRSNLAGSVFLSSESKNFSRGEFGQIVPGETVKMKWNLRVIDINSDAYASILFWDAAGNYSKEDIYYTAQKTDLEPRYHNFGAYKVNSETETKEFKILNLSDSAYTIKRINLKDGNQGFALTYAPELPLTLRKDESVNIKIAFSPAQSGNYVDSIGFGDDCRFVYRGMVEASVGSPVIEVQDISFSDLTVGGIDTMYSIISNTGVSELILYDYKNPESEDFSIVFEKAFTPESPYILEPGGRFTMAVIFNPTEIKSYRDSVTIISDANSLDSICHITARSVAPGLVASSYNWGRKRIFRTFFPSGPYPIQNENQSIILQNTGSAEILINGIEVEGTENSNAFEFNRQIFTNLKIPAGEKFEFKVQFRPTTYGEHYLKIRYLNNFGSSTVTELSGTGTVPRLSSQIINFDSVVVENYESPSIRRIQIKNLGFDEWAFADTLTIYDFFTENELKISEKWAYFGSSGFKLDKQIATFPIKLLPGNSYSLTAGFVPDNLGRMDADFLIISDALDTAVISLVGYGVEQALTFIGGTGISCVGFETVITGNVRNNSKKEISIKNIEIENPEPEFTVLTNDINDGFTLKAGESKNIDILYKPLSISEKQIEVILNDASSPFNNKKATFTGIPLQYQTDFSPKPAMMTANVGDVINQKVFFNSAHNLDGMKLNEIEIIIKFHENILKPIKESIKIGNDLIGSFKVQPDDSYRKAGELKLHLKSISEAEITKDCELFSIDFSVFYPNELISFCDIDYIGLPINNQCIEISSTKSRVNINPVCGNDIRIISIGSDKYHLSPVSPNPSVTNSIELSFGIGISAHTELRIFNSIGEEVSVLVNDFLSKGDYSINLNTVNFNSGLYFYQIKSGPFSETKSFVISK